MEQSQEFKWALKIVIKRQMRELIEQLRETGEEIAIVSADVEGGSCSHFGSPDGEWFMSEQRNITTNFLNFCMKRGKRVVNTSPNRISRAITKRQIRSEKLENGFLNRGSFCTSFSNAQGLEEIPELPVPSPREELQNTSPKSGLTHSCKEEFYGYSKTELRVSVPADLALGLTDEELAGIVGQLVVDKLTDISDAGSCSEKTSTLTNQESLKRMRFEVCTLSGTPVDLQSVCGMANQHTVLAEPVIQALDYLEVTSKLENSSKPVKVIVSMDTIGEAVQIAVEEPSIDTSLSFMPNNYNNMDMKLDVSDREDSDNFEVDSVEDPDYGQPKEVHETTKDTFEESIDNVKVNSTSRKAKKVKLDMSTKKMKEIERRRRIVTCPHCGISLVGAQNLKPHINRMHLKIRKHKCEICYKAFYASSGLESHVLAIHTRKCESCQEYLVESVPWEEGIAPSDPREVTCQCGASVTIFSKIGAKHKTIDVVEKDGNDANASKRRKTRSTQKFACGVCDKLFVSKVECKKHGQSHTFVKNFICDMCGAEYKNKQRLDVHMVTSHGIYQNKCEVCMRNYSNATALKVHMGKEHPKAMLL